MTAYAPSFTSRYRLKYSCQGKQHSIIFRQAGNLSAPSSAFVTAVETVLVDLSEVLYTDWIVQDAEYAQQGSDLFVPAPFAGVAGSHPTAGRSPAQVTVSVGIGGKSAIGNSTRGYIYGTSINPWGSTPPSDFRINYAEMPWAAQLYLNLNLLAAAGWCAADGNPVSYVRKYFNVLSSSYYQRKARG